MDPLTILATIRAGFEFGTELLKYLQTEHGQKMVEKSLESRENWEEFWGRVGGGLQKFFSGELFQGTPGIRGGG